LPKTCGLSSPILGVSGWRETIHARCCHWLVTNETFTTTVAAWPPGASKRKWVPQQGRR